MRKVFSAGFLRLLVFAGVALLLYPTLSGWWSQLRQSRAIAGYTAAAAGMDAADADRLWAEAEAYNADLWQSTARYRPTAAEHARYLQTLDVTGTGVMGHLEIPCIDLSLPICHGADEDVLQTAIGHIEGSSLPVGGAGTHCVLSGHSGLPSTRLFTDLDKLTEGDVFQLKVLGRTLTYQVDRITVVLPEEIGDLDLTEGADYCTLVTCTPYGINSHRLLVRGQRVADAPTAEPAHAAAAGPIVLLAAAAMLLALLGRRRREGRRTNKDPTGNDSSSGEGPQ